MNAIFSVLIVLLLSAPCFAQTAVSFSDQAEMTAKWQNGNAVFPVPKDYDGEYPTDFWLLEGPQVGEKTGAIKVQFNFKAKAAYDKAVLDTKSYTLIKKVVPVTEVGTTEVIK